MMRTLVAVIALAVAAGLTVADAVIVPGYAIVGARIVPVSQAPVERGTVVIRGSEIVSVEKGDDAPGDVQRIEGTSLTVYPGLIDLHSTAGLDQPSEQAPQNPETREVSERFRRRQLLRARVQAADLLDAGSSELEKLARAGFTNAVLVPRGDAIAGYSVLVDVVPPEIDPQVGRLAVDLRGPMVVKPSVALHVGFPGRGVQGAYPASLMGSIAFVRQAFADARHYHESDGAPRAAYDQDLAAMGPAIDGKVPVAFRASTPREIRRVLAFAREVGVTPIVVGGHGAGEVAGELKSAGASVVLSADYPTRPKSLGPDDDEALQAVEARAAARRAAAALAAAGVRFGFGSAGLRDVKDLVAAVRTAVQEGLPADAAVRALTLDSAALAGAATRLGSIERGKRANLLVTERDLLDEKVKVKHLFVAGRLVRPQP